VTAGANNAMCCYMISKSQVQAQAEGDNTYLWTLEFIEANDAN